MKKLLTVMTLLMSQFALAEATPAPPNCKADVHRQFDFWVGKWTAFSADGQKQGTNDIRLLMDGCVIQENWQGGNGQYRGTSYNFYDRSRNQWHQTWVDNGGGSLRLAGGLIDGSMVLQGERTDRDGTTVIDRITFSPLPDGRVRQHWQGSQDGGKSWTDVFDGYYQRAGD